MTDALKSKEEIDTTRALLDETEELLQFGIFTWDIRAHTVTWTPGLCALLGYHPDDVKEMTGLDFYRQHLQEEYRQPFQERIHAALREKNDFSYDTVMKTRGGVLKNISARGKLVYDENGAVVKVLCINRDVTSLRSFHKEQERNIMELNRSNRDLEEFAYIASHDLQEPLRKISMFTERLKAKFDQNVDEEGALFINRILASAANMRTLIEDLLDFSRVSRKSQPLEPVDMRAVLDAAVSGLDLKIEEANASISFSGCFPTIQAVHSEMTQLFDNILSNAVKFRKRNLPSEVQVHGDKLSPAEVHALGLSGAQTYYRIAVADNGIGFEPEYAERIFQIFQRLNGKSEYPGSGIGLAICKKIAEKYNGLLFAHSQPDKGATFTVILPEKQL